MELPFEKTVCRYWKQKLYTLHTQEQTQELRIPDGMPDVGRVISTWGQIVLRGKDWNDRSVGIQGGIMVWVLYQAEEEGTLQRLETWIPFRSRLDMPPGEEDDGVIRAQSMLRGIDARILSTRKLMLRCALGLLVQVLVPAQTEICAPGELPPDVEVLRRRYPLRLTVETGEKSFLLDEELELPGQARELVYFQLEPELAEQKVLGSKAVFHGLGNLHILYWNQEERLCCHDFQIPFGQYLELEQEYDEEAEIGNLLCVTSLELDVEESGLLRLRCGLVSQYAVRSRSVLDIVEDAYSPCRDVQTSVETLTIPAVLDSGTYSMELSARAQAGEWVDPGFRPELPQVNRQADEARIVQQGSFDLLTRQQDGQLQEKSAQAQGEMTMATHCTADTVVFSWRKGAVNSRREGADWRVDTQVALDISTISRQEIPMVTAMRLGPERGPEPERPALVIRRAEPDETLWELAKRCGSTVSAIERLNALDGEPEEDRLLLIPVM